MGDQDKLRDGSRVEQADVEPETQDPNLTWEAVYEREFERINNRRRIAFGLPPGDLKAEVPPKHLTGLALSGGGIRSALFNDGFLQAISHAGLLRYVDYLSSVSGGGYIAGHLVSSGIKKRECNEEGNFPPTPDLDAESLQGTKESFHDDDRFYPLGKDPVTGKSDRHRLMGVGNYLKDNLALFARYAASQVFTIAFYLGLVGIISTLIALCWRSLDYTEFREARTALNLEAGDELTIAFMPFLAVLSLFIFLGLLRGATFLFIRNIKADSWFSLRWFSFSRGLFKLSTLFAAIGLAVFLGNGYTFTSSTTVAGENRDSSAFILNHFAQIFAIVAAVVQVLVFLGRERLFKSEQADAKSWQAHAVRFISFASVMCFLFAMVHWMSRENISGHCMDRDPGIIRPEVRNWTQLLALADTPQERNCSKGCLICESESVATAEKSLSRSRDTWIRDPSDWSHEQKESPLSLPLRAYQRSVGTDVSSAGSRLDEQPITFRCVWLLEIGIGSAWHEFVRFKNPDCLDGDDYYFPSVDDKSAGQNLTGRARLHHHLGLVENDWIAKDQFLNVFNEVILPNRKLSDSLIEDILQLEEIESQQSDGEIAAATRKLLEIHSFGAVDHQESQTDKGTEDAKGVRNEVELINVLKEKIAARTNPDVDPQALATSIISFRSNRGMQDSDSIKRFNRDLLSVNYPGMLLSRRIVSTPVVVRHDQYARWQWLFFWFFIFTIGILGTWKLNWQMPFFHYYRRMLTEKFLLGWRGEPHSDPDFDLAGAALMPRKQYTTVHDISLTDADVTDTGLPYPMWLGSHLRGVMRSGEYDVFKEPFLFTPDHVGLTARDASAVISSTEYLARPSTGQPAKSRLSLSDVVAISGSALTPFMTRNFWLMLIMDFFGVRLGQWLPHPSKARQAGTMGYSYLPIIREAYRSRRETKKSSEKPNSQIPWDYGFIADGGYTDNLGVTELLRRRCKLMIVSDCGINTNADELGQLAKMLAEAGSRLGVQFLDLDHEGPIDFGRLQRNEQRLVPQPYLCFRVRYPKLSDGNADAAEEPHHPSHSFVDDDPNTGYLIYAQMAITDGDPLEIRQIRNRFKNFPDEPTSNQFYTESQVEGYRRLGYFIGSRICREMTRWTTCEINSATCHEMRHSAGDEASDPGKQSTDEVGERDNKTTDSIPDQEYFGQPKQQSIGQLKSQVEQGRQPLFSTVCRRLFAGYRLACFEEISFDEQDVLSEALWDPEEWCFVKFQSEAASLAAIFSKHKEPLNRHHLRRVCEQWISAYESNADVRAAYRHATFEDVNRAMISSLSSSRSSSLQLFKHLQFSVLKSMEATGGVKPDDLEIAMTVAHFCVIAIACHQLHRGTPHAVFQIGGRQKLIDLVIAMCVKQMSARELKEFELAQPDCADRFEVPPSGVWDKWMKNACPEIIEMRRCVFQDAEVQVTVSFFNVQLMHVMKSTGEYSSWCFGWRERRQAKKAVKNDKVSELHKIVDDAAQDSLFSL